MEQIKNSTSTSQLILTSKEYPINNTQTSNKKTLIIQNVEHTIKLINSFCNLKKINKDKNKLNKYKIIKSRIVIFLQKKNTFE